MDFGFFFFIGIIALCGRCVVCRATLAPIGCFSFTREDGCPRSDLCEVEFKCVEDFLFCFWGGGEVSWVRRRVFVVRGM